MEVPAPFAGTVKEIKINTGDKVSTGSLIMVFEVAGAHLLRLRHRLRLRLRRGSSRCCWRERRSRSGHRR
jgi:pyruvate/2-oxoglutarate dehydrogenase complex dihydrolipoamide acyltransferase (E2) component